MFHQFFVPLEDSTYMRFFWLEDNDTEKELVEYWSMVHIMGKRDSPAIANLGLRRAALANAELDPQSWIEDDGFFKAEDGLIRSGGRLHRSSLSFGRTHPAVLFPGLAADCLLGYIHATAAAHQGRHITAGAVRDAGYQVLGGKRRIEKLIRECRTCRRLRAKPDEQRMADLPSCRLEESPPFRKVGIDVFGHFYVSHGRETRRNTGSAKMWILLISCLYSRAIHLETLKSMTGEPFRMAFARFTCKGGKCVHIRSDAGSNFMGAKNEDESILTQEILGQVRRDPQFQDFTWEVNPPHASHFGGAWERKTNRLR